MRKLRTVQGVLHPIKVKMLSHKYIQKILAEKDEVVAGGYVPAENTIYIDREQNAAAILHTLLHEMIHAAIHHTSGLDEEAICDAYAAWLMRLFKITNVEDLFIDGK